MPTETFFRLPEEKRERIVNAAWAEFCGVSYAAVSINRIIRAAEIPRGSFYQYFADKDDLFFYLAEGVRDYALEGFLGLLRSCGGDLFRTMPDAYDGVRRAAGTAELLPVRRSLDFIRRNQGMDLRTFLARSGGLPLDRVWEALDTSRFRRRDRPFIQSVHQLCVLSLGSAVADLMAHPEHADADRAQLLEYLSIIEYGCKEDIA